MHADALTAPRWQQLGDLIAARTGLHFPPERQTDLRRALNEAASEFGCLDGESCADRLLRAPLSPENLRKLVPYLTIGETYFFRERPSFDALATQVLPPLLARKRAGDRRLRLWSAACSSGEEAYSLAMLVQQLVPDWRDWDVRILATDINPDFLRKAEAGVYGSWSFREGTQLRERYFSPVGEQRFRVHADLREMITFTELNLAEDPFPGLGRDHHAMDLILCRNLLIYFTAAHARRLVDNLRRCLGDEGWLVVSPSECSQALFTGFSPVNFPGSILYRKTGTGDVASTPAKEFTPPALAPAAPLSEHEVARMFAAPAGAADPVTDHPSPAVDTATAGATDEQSDDELTAARAAYACGDYAETVRCLTPPATPMPTTCDAWSLLTRALANQGALREALDASERWMALDKLDPAAHYLNALVLQELGERARARTALQRAIYLLPEFTLAHFALGNQARAEARPAEARRHFDNAARLLAGRPADEPLAESEGLTAGRLREIIVALGREA